MNTALVSWQGHAKSARVGRFEQPSQRDIRKQHTLIHNYAFFKMNEQWACVMVERCPDRWRSYMAQFLSLDFIFPCLHLELLYSLCPAGMHITCFFASAMDQWAQRQHANTDFFVIQLVQVYAGMELNDYFCSCMCWNIGLGACDVLKCFPPASAKMDSILTSRHCRQSDTQPATWTHSVLLSTDSQTRREPEK